MRKFSEKKVRRMKLKVTVAFGTTRVVVPCDGDVSVRDLIDAAIVRYRKATNKVRQFFSAPKAAVCVANSCRPSPQVSACQ